MSGARARAGATLVEVCLAIALAGVVLAAFTPAFFAAIRTSKVAEATELLAAMHHGASAYWAATHRGARRCLPAGAGPTPAMPSEVPRTVAFDEPSVEGSATWRALGLEGAREIRYRYTFAPRATGCNLGKSPGAELVGFVAEGDLDGDGAFSRFERRAGMGPDGELVPIGVLAIDDRVE